MTKLKPNDMMFEEVGFMYQIDTKKYPWLISKYEVRDKIEEYEILSALPNGWLISFGDLMCADLDEVIKRDHLTDFRIDEAKEKYGSMRLYTSGGNDETQRIIDDYSALSENICMICGQPDVHMTTCGWYYPCCEECWNNDRISNRKPYEEAYSKDSNGCMAESRGYIKYTSNGKETITFDIRPLAKRIRDYWDERFGDER